MTDLLASSALPIHTSFRYSYPELAKIMDILHQGSIAEIERGAEMGALFVMGALIAPTWSSPVNDSPLSQYSCLVLGSGVGKAAYTTRGPARLIDAALRWYDATSPTLVANQKPASHVGLFRLLRANPALVLSYDELGSTLHAILASGANSSSQLIGTALLEAYMSPHLLDGSATKNEADSTTAVERPVPSVIGGMTFDSLEMIAKLPAFRNDGLLGRFEIVTETEYIHQVSVEDFKKIEPLVLSDIEILLDASSETRKKIQHCRRKDPLGENDSAMVQTLTFGERHSLVIQQKALEIYWDFQGICRIQAHEERGLIAGYVNRLPQRAMRTASLLCFFRGCREILLCDIEAAIGWHLKNYHAIKPFLQVANSETTIDKLISQMRELPSDQWLTKTLIRRCLPRSLRDCQKMDMARAIEIMVESGEITVKSETDKTGRVNYFFRKIERKPENV